MFFFALFNQKAQNALKYYKQYKGKTEVEINVFNIEFERMKSIAHEHHADQMLRISDFSEFFFFSNKKNNDHSNKQNSYIFTANSEAIKGILIGIALAYFVQFTGCYTILTYAVYIFERTGTNLNPYISSISLALMLSLGALFTTQLADKLGRKLFMIISLLGSAAGLSCLSLFMYLIKHGYDLTKYSWVPVVCLAFVILISAAGIIPLSHVCRVENLPTKVMMILHTFSFNSMEFMINFSFRFEPLGWRSVFLP